jgi:hypothetical protein
MMLLISKAKAAREQAHFGERTSGADKAPVERQTGDRSYLGLSDAGQEQ